MGTQLPEPFLRGPAPPVPFLGAVTVTVPGLSLSASTFPAILVSLDSAAPFFGSLPAFCLCTELDHRLSQWHSSTSLPELVLL